MEKDDRITRICGKVLLVAFTAVLTAGLLWVVAAIVTNFPR